MSLLRRPVPCKTGFIKNVCLSQVQLPQSSQIPSLWLAFQNKPQLLFSLIGTFLLIRLSFRHGPLSDTGLIAVLGSKSSERQRENRKCRVALYLKLFVFVLSLLLTWSLQKPPAILASYFGNLSALRKLIQCGADVALVSSTGLNCLDAAIKSGNTDVCMELVKNEKYES